MRIKIGDSVSLGVELQGTGQPLLFIHGFPMDRQMWNAQVDFFQSLRRVIAVDLRGYGESDPLTAPSSIGQMAKEVADLLDRLEISEPIALCGLSMGGYIAQHLVKFWPQRFERLILCHTRSAADTPEIARGRRLAMETIRQKGSQEFLAAMLTRLVSQQTRTAKQEVVAALWKEMQAAPQPSILLTLEALASRPDTTAWLPEIDCPVLVVAGAEDSITPSAEMQDMANAITQSRFTCLSECGHLSPLEQAGAFNQLLLSFLNEPSRE